MADYGTVQFRSARASGILINHLGSGAPDHIGFYGAAGTAQAIEVQSFNGTTFITDTNGDVPAYLGAASGALTNCKWASGSTVIVSGWGAVNIADLNLYNPVNHDAVYPDFENRPSGTLMIRYSASGVSAVHTYNAKIWAYDVDTGVTTAPPDATVYAFEINASGQTFSAAYSGVWTAIQGNGSPLYFADHKPSNGWLANNEHIWVAAISVKPTAVGRLNMGLVFSMQYV